MKLSEAINLGSTLKPQTFGAFVDEDGTCAMGASLEAVGKLAKRTSTNEQRVKKIWPWLKWEFRRKFCPQCGKWKNFKNVYGLIIHLNDEDQLSRQQIAHLISQIETRAVCQIEMLVPSYQTLRLTELESNLGKRKTKNDRALHTSHSGSEPVVQEMQPADHASH